MTQRGVADDVLGRFGRQQHDVFERVRKGSLDPEEVMQAVQEVIDRPRFYRDIRKEGWEPTEDVTEPEEISISDFELVRFPPGSDNTGTLGDETRKHAKNIGANLGQRHAKYLFEHQEEIPAEWRDYCFVFPGTVWRNRRNIPNAMFLLWDWDDESWYPHFHYIGGGFGSNARLLCPRK